MARLFSQNATTIRGSVGGITYTANQYQAIVLRARVSPTQPNSNFQRFVRTGASVAESVWKTLSEAVKADWLNFASTVSYSGPFGSYTVPGRNLFYGWVGLRNYLISRGSAFTSPTTAPPDSPGRLVPPGAFVITAPATGTGFLITFFNFNSAPVFCVGVRSRAFNNSRNSYKGPFLSSTHLPSAVVQPATGGSLSFTGLVAGQVYFVRLYMITSGGACNVSVDSVLRITAVVSS